MSLVLSVQPPSYPAESITRAARILRDGGVAVFPTETVYGIGADIRCPEAVSRVFALKKRDLSQPLMAHCASPLQMLEYVTEVPPWVQPLLGQFWPGPLSLVLRCSENVPSVVTSGGQTVGIRMVAHPATRDLLEELGAPIAGTSANLHGEPATSRFGAVNPALLGQVDVALDAGLCGKHVPSTVLDVTQRPPRVLRVGAVGVQELERVVGQVLVGSGSTV